MMIIELTELTDKITETTEQYIKEFENVKLVTQDEENMTINAQNGAFTVTITINKKDIPGLFIKEATK